MIVRPLSPLFPSGALVTIQRIILRVACTGGGVAADPAMNPADVAKLLAFRAPQPTWIEVTHGFEDERDTPFAALCDFGRAHPSHVCLTCGKHFDIWVSVKHNGQPADQDAMDAARARCTLASFSPHVPSIAPGFFDGFGVLREVSVSPGTRVTEASFRGCAYGAGALLGGARVWSV